MFEWRGFRKQDALWAGMVLVLLVLIWWATDWSALLFVVVGCVVASFGIIALVGVLVYTFIMKDRDRTGKGEDDG